MHYMLLVTEGARLLLVFNFHIQFQVLFILRCRVVVMVGYWMEGVGKNVDLYITMEHIPR